MNELPQKPDELLWKTAIVSALFDKKSNGKNEFYLNVEELSELFLKVKGILPNSTEWNTYLTPQIVWLSIESSFSHKKKDHIFPGKEAFLQHVEDVVEELRQVFAID